MEHLTETTSYSNNLEDNKNEISDYYKMINITLLDENANFRIISPFKIHKSLNLISETWDFIKYSNGHKTLTIKETNDTKFQDFLKLNKIEINGVPYNIKTNELLSNINTNKGVIYSKYLLTVSDDEILFNLKSQNVSEIYRYKRLTSDDTWVDTGSFALTFSNKIRPERILVCFLNLKVHPILQKPMQCAHCKLIGHTIRRCKSLIYTYCDTCHHRVSNSKIHECIKICKNCKGAHYSDQKTCPAYLKEIKILQIKTKYNISYFEAQKRFYLDSNKQIVECIQPEDNVKYTQEMKEIQTDRNKIELVNTELKLLNEEQQTTIRLLTEENNNLNEHIKLITKKLEINKKLTDTMLNQLKGSTEINHNLSEALKESQEQKVILNQISENFKKKCETAQYFASHMKKFIDKTKKTSLEFKMYMDNFLNKNDSSDDFEDEE